MRICYIYCDIPSYVKNRTVLKGLKQNRVEVIECKDSSSFYLARHIKKVKEFFAKRKNNFDAVLVGFVGQPIVPIIRKLTDKPILFDAYMSVYDTFCFDKKKVNPSSLLGKLCYKIDLLSCKAADKVILDTIQHANYFIEEFHLDKRKFERVWVGSDDELFYPRLKKRKDKKFIVEFHGAFIPLQGVEYIVHAAKILEGYNDIQFIIIGSGQTFEKCFNLAKALNLKNVKFLGPKSYEEIPKYIAEADVGLGIFGNTSKTQRVIPNKAYEILAMGKPLITAETPATKELLKNRKNVLYCKTADSKSLAKAILELKKNKKLREKIARNGYNLFKENCTPKVIGKEIKEIAIKLLKQKKN